MKVWILVFMFHGWPVASGPHELEVCLIMMEYQVQGHCWNPRTNERKGWKEPRK